LPKLAPSLGKFAVDQSRVKGLPSLSDCAIYAASTQENGRATGFTYGLKISIAKRRERRGPIGAQHLCRFKHRGALDAGPDVE
jgi:hypothetical protein